MLKLKRFLKGRWIPLPAAKGVDFLIRPVHFSEALEIRTGIRKSIPIDILEPKSQRQIPILMEDVDSSTYSKAIFDYMLSDFRGPISIEDEEGKEIKVESGMTAEDVIKIKQKIRNALFDDESIRNFVQEQAEEILKDETEKFQEEQGNLSSSLGG